MVKVLIKKLSPEVKSPSYKTNGASGMDLIAFVKKPIKILDVKTIYNLACPASPIFYKK